MKKILFISTGVSQQQLDYYGLSGGEVRLAEIIRGFLQADVQVHLLTQSAAEKFCQIFNLKNVICHNYNFKTQSPKRSGILISSLKILLSRLPLSLKQVLPDFVYSANELPWDVWPAFRMKLFNKKIKWVAVVHWLPPIKFWQRKKSSLINSLLFLMGERLSVFLIKHLSDIILAVSNSTAYQLRNVGVEKNKIKVVSCGVNFLKINQLAKQVTEKKHEAVFIKRIHAVKGVFDLIEIWQEVVRSHPQAKLALVGAGFDKQKAEKIIQQNKLTANITLFGHVLDFEEKIKILAQSKLFVLPSYEENWAIVIGEAMACGVPVMAYDLPELIDVWQNNFVHIPRGNKHFFADKIIEYLKNDQIRELQGMQGYNYIQQFDWSKIAEEEIKIIKNL